MGIRIIYCSIKTVFFTKRCDINKSEISNISIRNQKKNRDESNDRIEDNINHNELKDNWPQDKHVTRTCGQNLQDGMLFLRTQSKDSYQTNVMI